MPRSALKAKDKRGLPPPDSVYRSGLVSQFINKLILCGKKSVAERIVYDALEMIKEKSGEEPLSVFTRAMENVRPLVEVRARRVGGATYQVPMEVRPERGISMAMRWIFSYARLKTGKPMSEKLADELIAASKKEGASFKKREDTHRMAEANKAFAHYRW
ncbi:MAG: 30S ribosomal protein S7 [Elusimicrobia bacterium]|nr:30S ribosomal protein S7 [Candidatus Obscuribacterium magneticum]